MNICFCAKQDIKMVMDFIDKHWHTNHILSRNKALMDYQHYDKNRCRYNYVISKENDVIFGILGFIPLDKFDNTLSDTNTIWLSLWKNRKDAPANIGLALLKFLEHNVKYDILGTIGISDEAEQIYKILKFKTGYLNQYYMPNCTLNNFNIAVKPQIQYISNKNGISLQKISSDILKDININKTFKPNKTIRYVIEKYAYHPIYNYCFLYFKLADILLICREVSVGQYKALRIVDMLGDINNLYLCAYALSRHINDNNYEYIDFLNYGVPEDIFSKAGFIKLETMGDTIIPMYFEPFLQENKKIHFAYKTNIKENIMLFKADADQDRPNVDERIIT
jgi:hypothetical protein